MIGLAPQAATAGPAPVGGSSSELSGRVAGGPSGCPSAWDGQGGRGRATRRQRVALHVALGLQDTSAVEPARNSKARRRHARGLALREQSWAPALARVHQGQGLDGS